MCRTLVRLVCLSSLLLCAAALALTRYSHRTWHEIVWRTDAAAASEGAHGSLGSVLREYRERGGVPGQRPGIKPWRRAAQPQLASLAPPPAPRTPVTRQYASLALAGGRVEYRRYPDPTVPYV